MAASATIGRPLRRSLGKLLFSGNAYSDVAVIRPASALPEGQEGGRAVGIPPGIKHVIMMSEVESGELTGKLAAAKEMWLRSDGQRGIVFVPTAEDVKQAIGVLNFWGVPGVQNLQQALGISGERPLQGTVESGRRRAGSSQELVALARDSGVGASAMTRGARGKELFVVPVSGSRGLHIQDVALVFVLQPPFAMDEYLHMAGRTGRNGRSGTVVTVASLEEMKKMSSWQTPLGISFEVKYGNQL